MAKTSSKKTSSKKTSSRKTRSKNVYSSTTNASRSGYNYQLGSCTSSLDFDPTVGPVAGSNGQPTQEYSAYRRYLALTHVAPAYEYAPASCVRRLASLHRRVQKQCRRISRLARRAGMPSSGLLSAYVKAVAECRGEDGESLSVAYDMAVSAALARRQKPMRTYQCADSISTVHGRIVTRLVSNCNMANTSLMALTSCERTDPTGCLATARTTFRLMMGLSRLHRSLESATIPGDLVNRPRAMAWSTIIDWFRSEDMQRCRRTMRRYAAYGFTYSPCST